MLSIDNAKILTAFLQKYVNKNIVWSSVLRQINDYNKLVSKIINLSWKDTDISTNLTNELLQEIIINITRVDKNKKIGIYFAKNDKHTLLSKQALFIKLLSKVLSLLSYTYIISDDIDIVQDYDIIILINIPNKPINEKSAYKIRTFNSPYFGHYNIIRRIDNESEEHIKEKIIVYNLINALIFDELSSCDITKLDIYKYILLKKQ